MSTRSKAAALVAALALIATSARSDGIGGQGVLGQGTFGGIGGMFAAATPPVTTGSALLVDLTNPALLVDNTNPACLVGGC